jgi:hypothetical protein
MSPETTPTPSATSSEEPPPYAKHSCSGPGIGPLEAEGQFPPPENWRETSELVGPVGTDIGQFATRPEADFGPIGGGHRAYAFAVIVEAGRSVTLVIPSAHRDRIMFNLDPGRHGPDGGYELTDGEPAVSLEACESEDTRFLEGVIIAGPGCAAIDIVTDQGREPSRLPVSFAAGDCP